MSPLFNWLSERAAGVLLHPTALPSNQGVGSFGKSARRFVDFLADAHARYWQVCPLGPTSFGDSPYQCFSSFAGNPYLIDLDELVEIGFLAESDLGEVRDLPHDHMDSGKLWSAFENVQAILYRNAKAEPKKLESFGDFEQFKKDNSSWLPCYALFVALKKHFDGKPWYEWGENTGTFSQAKEKFSDEQQVCDDVELVETVQFIFFSQWKKLREYAKERGVEIIGDTPIYATLDSADVWQNPEIFQLDDAGKPLAVAGVPPDYFSETGQYWGNPLYDWAALKKTNYAWWIARLRACFALYDVVRIDHFRAFNDYWRIPAGAPDARTGEWVDGPGIAFFDAVKKALGNAKLIAEDLGDLNSGVRELLAQTGLPGMAVLEFAFGSGPKNPYLPHNVSDNIIIYPGTHDNDTVVGWYNTCGQDERDFFRRYLWTNGNAPHWTMLNAAMKTRARIAIVSVQDILGLGSEARFNEPGTMGKNWQWRLTEELFNKLLERTSAFRDLIDISARA